MRIFLKILKYLGLFILVSVSSYVLMAVILSYWPVQGKEEVCDKNKEVFVATNGVHLYLVIPENDLSMRLKSKLPSTSGVVYYSFGWGDREFYLNTPEWKDLSLSTAFSALFKQSNTAMHVRLYVSKMDHWIKVAVCEDQLKALNNYVVNSFKKSTENFTPIGGVEGYSSNDYFYEAKGSYTMFDTSNVWVNKALKKAKITTSVWSPFDFGVLHHLN